ncbi:MAG: hypothetical protein SWH54_15415 [Thermodesulfobacteriota bacterium]|nr:hypothetical protein [Thermodesulfobacteriota bacterium]
MAAYQYQRDSVYFVKIAQGLTEAGAEELTELAPKTLPRSLAEFILARTHQPCIELII